MTGNYRFKEAENIEAQTEAPNAAGAIY